VGARRRRWRARAPGAMAGRGTREPRGKRGEGLGWVLRMEGGGEFYVYAIKKNCGDLCAIKKKLLAPVCHRPKLLYPLCHSVHDPLEIHR
jgi:hypothetical protein